MSFDIEAQIGTNSTITSSGVLGAHASMPMGLQNLAISGALGTGDAVGFGVAVNIVTDHVDALIGANTHATVTGAVTVTAVAGLTSIPVTGVPIVEDTLASISSIAASGAAGDGDAAVAGSVIVDVFDLRTRAWIADGVTINPTGTVPAGSSALISASAPIKIVNIAGGVAATTGDAGVGMALIVDIIDSDTRAYIGNNVTLRVGGAVSVSAVGGLDFWALAASLGASTSEAGVAGSFGLLLYGANILPGTDDGVRAWIGGGTLTPTTVSGSSISVTAAAPNTYSIIAGNIGIGSEAGVGVSAAILVATGRVTATTAAGDTLTATTGDVTVSATQSESITLVAIGGSGGGTAGVAGSAAVNVLTNTTTASIGNGTTLSAGDDVSVTASDTTEVLGLAGTLGCGGTITSELCNSAATSQAWTGPAPPKANSGMPRQSTPRSVA